MRVRAKVAVFIDNVHHKEGDEFDYSGPPNHNLEPLDKDGKPIEANQAPKPKGKEEDDDEPEKRFAKHK